MTTRLSVWLDNFAMQKLVDLLFFAFRPQISELPQPTAEKLCHMIGNRSSLKSEVQKFGENVGEPTIQKLAHNLAY